MATRINSYRELRVYQEAMELAIEIFEMTKTYPKEERFSLINQIRRSSRSVCANLAGLAQKTIPSSVVGRLSDVETEACETQVWLEMSTKCKYIKAEQEMILSDRYEKLIGQVVTMIEGADKWVIKRK
jgi:four helix bundle protein